MSSLSKIVNELLEIVSPLSSIDSEDMILLLGYNTIAEDLSGNLTEISTNLEDMFSYIVEIDTILASDDVDYLQVQNIIETFFTSFVKLIDNINEVSNIIENDIGGIDPEDLVSSIADRLISWLIVRYFDRKFPALYKALNVLGIFCLKHHVESVNRPSFTEYKVEWERIIEIICDPVDAIKSIYNWGTAEVNLEPLLMELQEFLWLKMIPAGMCDTPIYMLNKYNEMLGDEFPIPSIPTKTLEIIIFSQPEIDLDLRVSLTQLPPLGGDLSTSGIGLCLEVSTDVHINIPITKSAELQLSGGLGRSAGAYLTIIPGQSPSVFLDTPDINCGTISTAILLSLSSDKGILIGKPNGNRFEIEDITGKAELTLSFSERTDFLFEISLHRGQIIIKCNDADSFLSKILPEDGIQAEFDITAGISIFEGLYFQGSGALEVTLPLHFKLGPIEIISIYLRFGFQNKALDIAIGVSITAVIGPISASIERIGLQGDVTFPSDKKGNLGIFNFDPSFLSPTGAGLAIDAGPVTGGGYLEFDNDNKRYAGILQLAFGEIGLIAIGLITTRMPDGSKDFSMLVIISVEFDPPISLPYNFNLSGVGGFLGIKRSMNIDYLREGLKQGTLDSVLFPQDPILNASRIISDLRAGFPPTKERYVVGPMAIIGWGNPLVIRAEIGIFIEVPSPVRIAILGQITAEFPNAEEDSETIVVIHMDILGVLDFEKKSFALDAVIYDSRILAYTLSGDMAMRLYWGDPPFFLMSFGGYNPKFKVRPGTPVLRRMMLSLGSGDNPRLSLECYMALSSNTTQFGAKLELIYRKSGFKVHGYLYFHCLFIFSPFSFVVDMGAGVDVFKRSRCLFSITLDFTLSGPTPWKAKGTAKFKVLFVKVKIRFDKTWGKRQSISLPATDPWDELKSALENPGNWKGLLPGEKEQVIRIKKLEDSPDVITVHPKGRLEISQKVVPLNMTLEKYGNGPIAGDIEYKVTELKINDVLIEDPLETGELDYSKDYFATAQFIKMSDSKKLSIASFEKEDANILIGSDEISMGPELPYDLEYETEVIDENRVTKALPSTPVFWNVGEILIKGRARKQNFLAGKKFKDSVIKPLVSLKDEKYKVVTKDGFNSVTEIVNSYSKAQELMQGYLKSHPEQDGNLQIVNEYEAAI